MREVAAASGLESDLFVACLATILEVPLAEVPVLGEGESPGKSLVSRWLGGLGMGLVPVDNAGTFGWPGPWVGRVRSPAGGAGFVVMFGSPVGGVAWDPGSLTVTPGWTIEGGFVVAALDVALARPPAWTEPRTDGTVEGLFVAEGAGTPARAVAITRALSGRGLEGDRHVTGKGTFASGVPGSALTLIEAEVCESFTPVLEASVHRRNIVTRGIELNGLVGRDFTIGGVRCRGVRLCEPCVVIDRYAGRSVLRPLVHRGGLRVDIIGDGEISIGDPIRRT